MCARGGGGLSAHNAGLAVGSIGSGGSQREPRHGCVSIERSRLDSHLQSSFHGAPCASLTTFVVLRRISPTHPPTLAIIQPYRLLCAQTNTNPSAFTSASRAARPSIEPRSFWRHYRSYARLTRASPGTTGPPASRAAHVRSWRRWGECSQRSARRRSSIGRGGSQREPRRGCPSSGADWTHTSNGASTVRPARR